MNIMSTHWLLVLPFEGNMAGPVSRSKRRIRLKARENKVLAPLQANNARSEGLNGRPNDDRSSKSRVALCCAGARKPDAS
ncbi:hypothetical protein HaLaN_05057 [Haematococcus lacustris]|uniref:Uncharacterized protein n=1 Tax=Haematococcus lacustris TaxID=44745 RepID=A0A699YPZ1_HAELA|nr:hypothetical protein HaLaN_05057 [Haematococcus lacustris]